MFSFCGFSEKIKLVPYAPAVFKAFAGLGREKYGFLVYVSFCIGSGSCAAGNCCLLFLEFLLVSKTNPGFEKKKKKKKIHAIHATWIFFLIRISYDDFDDIIEGCI